MGEDEKKSVATRVGQRSMVKDAELSGRQEIDHGQALPWSHCGMSSDQWPVAPSILKAKMEEFRVKFGLKRVAAARVAEAVIANRGAGHPLDFALRPSTVASMPFDTLGLGKRLTAERMCADRHPGLCRRDDKDNIKDVLRIHKLCVDNIAKLNGNHCLGGYACLLCTGFRGEQLEQTVADGLLCDAFRAYWLCSMNLKKHMQN